MLLGACQAAERQLWLSICCCGCCWCGWLVGPLVGSAVLRWRDWLPTHVVIALLAALSSVLLHEETNPAKPSSQSRLCACSRGVFVPLGTQCRHMHGWWDCTG